MQAKLSSRTIRELENGKFKNDCIWMKKKKVDCEKI